MKNKKNFAVGVSNVIGVILLIMFNNGFDALLIFLITFNISTCIPNLYFAFRKEKQNVKN